MDRLSENPEKFASRKQDHIRLSLDAQNEAIGNNGLDQITLIHDALPEVNFEDIDIKLKNSFGLNLETPFLVSSMTAGHVDSTNLNKRLAKACANNAWLMGVGSQRRELFDPEAAQEWRELRKEVPKVKLLGNIGLSQLIHTNVEQVQRLVDSLEAVAMIVHSNPLQEAIQPEGTPFFKGGLEALENLSRHLSVPVVFKETGCGISKVTCRKLNETGVAAVDVSGYGGTHWGRIEGQRSGAGSLSQQVSQTFATWGISTLQSVRNAMQSDPQFEVWASGGVRSGLDAAKLIALGSTVVGFAKPILQAALTGEEDLDLKMKLIERELRTAMFCTGSENLQALQQQGVYECQQR